jgi:hypothetical protein
MTKFFKDKPYDFGLLSIKEECAKFCFSSGGSHQFENCAGDVDGAIITGNTAMEEVATGATASVRCTEVSGIGVYIENHVGNTILYSALG